MAPKIDEVRHCSTYANLDLICLSETWLQEHIHYNVVSVNGFNLLRLDRRTNVHGGVCTYIKDTIQFSLLDDFLPSSCLEVLWIKIRPNRLPRGVSSIVVGTVYHPPRADNTAMLTYLMDSLSLIETRHPNCGIILLGDFNGLNVAKLKSSVQLKQIVNFPTRGQNTLDLILTNLQDYYDTPVSRPPFGLSDHVSIEVKPKSRAQIPKSRKTIKSRDLRPSSRLAIGTYLQQVDVTSLLATVNTCSEKMTLFESIVNVGLDLVLPLRSKTIHRNEPPWISSSLKNLIRRRQIAHSQGNLSEFRMLRNRVNRERKICRAKYFDAKVSPLKECKPSAWWKEVKKLSSMTSVSYGGDYIMKSLQNIDGVSSPLDLANVINDCFILPMREFTPLQSSFMPEGDPSLSTDFVISSDAVYKKLSLLNPTKAQGPDGVPAWLLKENADCLAEPITDILNCSFREGRLPPSWKSADIVPVPKEKPVREVNRDLQPTSLTPILSKVAEDFVVEEFAKPIILKEIHETQFGTVPKSST